MGKGDKFTQQNKNPNPPYWFAHFKVYLCISGGHNYCLQWLTIFRQCQNRNLNTGSEGRRKAVKKFSVYRATKKREQSEQPRKCMDHIWTPRNHSYTVTVLNSAKYWKKANVQLLLKLGYPEKTAGLSRWSFIKPAPMVQCWIIGCFWTVETSAIANPVQDSVQKTEIFVPPGTQTACGEH